MTDTAKPEGADGGLAKTYAPAEIEARRYAEWEQADSFACNPASNRTPYTIMMPPPNVTGSLHMGHALTFTLQDALVRFWRMRGRDALWQPGTDHAGIATQMVVERRLAERGVALDRGGAAIDGGKQLIGRAAFLDEAWKWKAESGGTITRQLRRLGASKSSSATSRAISGTSNIRSKARRAASSSLPPRGLKPCWATRASPFIPTIRASRICMERTRYFRLSAASCVLSRTIIPTPKKARAP
jgi:hypothetical protein